MTDCGRQPEDRRSLAFPAWALAAYLGVSMAQAGPASAAGSTRHVDWTTTCSSEDGAACIAETAVRRVGGATHLRVNRDAKGRAQDVTLVTGAAGLAKSAPLSLWVDGNAPLSIRYASAVGQIGSDSYRLTDAALVRKLVTQMKRGRRLRINYRDRAGKNHTVEFSMMGLTAALGSLQKGEPAAGPQGPPDLYPPPVDDGRPKTRDAPQQADIVFTPAGETPPVGGCYEHRRIHDEKGYFTGWSSTYRC